MAKKDERWQLDGREVRVTSLEKLFWPQSGFRKGDLLAYYRMVAPVLLPYMQARPFIMRAWPDGIDGKSYYRWRVPRHAPDWLERYPYPLQGGRRQAEMAVVDELPELIWVVNQGVIEMHPMTATRHDIDHPTWLFFDLDPLPDMSFARVLQVAGWIHELLEALALIGMPKTSGGDGLHIFVPLQPHYSFEAVRAWLARFIERLEERAPDAVTAAKRLDERDGKVMVDYSQNAMGKSIVAPYSVRAKPGAPVSAPLTWAEVRAGRVAPGHFTLSTMPTRLAEQGDLFAPVLLQPQTLPAW